MLSLDKTDGAQDRAVGAVPDREAQRQPIGCLRAELWQRTSSGFAVKDRSYGCLFADAELGKDSTKKVVR